MSFKKIFNPKTLIGAATGFATGGPFGAVAGGLLAGAGGGGKTPKLKDGKNALQGINRISTRGFDFTRSATGFDLRSQQDFAGMESALRGRVSGLDPTSRLSGIGANRSALAGIQTRSQALRDEVAGLRGQNLDLSGFGDIRSRFSQLAGQAGATDLSEFGRLRGDVRGIREGLDGALAEERRTAIRNARAESVGNLRESLGRRGVLGSSFAQDALARQELEFGQAEGMAVAEAKLQEAAMAGQLAGLEGDILNTEVSQSLASLSLSGQLTAQEQSALRDQSSLALQEAALKGQLFQLDAGLLEQQSRNVFISMGLTDQEAQVFSNQLSQIMSEAQILLQSSQRELSEFAVAGNIANGVQANVTDIAQMNAMLAIKAAEARGNFLSGLGSAGFFEGFGDLIGSIFGV